MAKTERERITVLISVTTPRTLGWMICLASQLSPAGEIVRLVKAEPKKNPRHTENGFCEKITKTALNHTFNFGVC